MRWLGALALLAAPASAQEWIDYPRLFQDRAADVVEDGGDAFLPLGGGVTVRRLADGSYQGFDESPGGAVGCLFMIAVDVERVLRQCPMVGTEADRARMTARVDRIGGFVAANAYPPRDWPVLRDRLRALEPEAPSPAECAAFADPGSDTGALVAAITAEGFDGALDAAFAVPRLPVSDPCL